MNNLRSFLNKLGPGMITAALIFGPGSLTVNAKLGAGFGYSMLWLIAVSVFFMVIFTQMTARIGLSIDKSLIQTINNQYGKIFGWIIGVGVFLVCAAFQAGNAIGVGIAFGEMFGTSSVPFVWIGTAIAIGMLFTKNFYQVLEKVMLVLVGIMLISFLLTFIISRPSMLDFAIGFVPKMPSGAMLLSIALVASSFSIVGAFFQTYLVRAKGWGNNDISDAQWEARTSILILGFISILVMAVAANVLGSQQLSVNSAADMAKALEPLYGRMTQYVFLIGLFGAAFSSMTGNATIGGSVLADTFWGTHHFHLPKVKGCIIALLLAGALIATIFGGLPLELIVFAQAITIVIVPLIGVFILLVANKKTLMGAFTNKLPHNIVGGLGLLLLLILAFHQLVRLLA